MSEAQSPSGASATLWAAIAGIVALTAALLLSSHIVADKIASSLRESRQGHRRDSEPDQRERGPDGKARPRGGGGGSFGGRPYRFIGFNTTDAVPAEAEWVYIPAGTGLVSSDRESLPHFTRESPLPKVKEDNLEVTAKISHYKRANAGTRLKLKLQRFEGGVWTDMPGEMELNLDNTNATTYSFDISSGKRRFVRAKLYFYNTTPNVIASDDFAVLVVTDVELK